MSTRLKILTVVALLLAGGAAWRWLLCGDQTISHLDPETARIERLRRKGDVVALAREMSNGDVKAAGLAADAMGRLGAAAVPHLREAMRNPRPEVRGRAALALARASGRDEAALLAETATQDKSASVRAMAATALGDAYAYTELDTLMQALEDPDESVRRRAAQAIVRVTGVDFIFRAEAPPEQRRKIIEIIRRHLSDMKWRAKMYYTGPRGKHKR